LGVVRAGESDFVLADLPGLIEGAHDGTGLGTRFLGHAERCAVILHLIDGTEAEIVHAYRTIRAELSSYGHGLAEKPEILALNKADAIPKDAIARKRKALEKASSMSSPACPAKGWTRSSTHWRARSPARAPPNAATPSPREDGRHERSLRKRQAHRGEGRLESPDRRR
jgi:GTP-binding protein